MDLFRRRTRNAFLALALVAAALAPARSAWAAKNRTIVLRAAGSGALIGGIAGLASYPFAKSTGTIIAGAAVGALLGTVYGFYLVDRRDRMYRSAELDRSPGARVLAGLEAANEARNAVLRRGKPAGAEFALPVSFEF
jgi:hypothetical protein